MHINQTVLFNNKNYI
uniref:Uncharacterized protein n=1 Tax=Anguilla anguilla TaxID=7936 RepID=A0A0E9RWU5_ANGAN